jgi:tetratricopeptide (TPR) repeat protein
LEEAEDALKKVIDLNSEYIGVHSALGCVYLAQSRKNAAFVEVSKEPDESLRLYGLSLVHFAAGKSDEADEALEQLIEKHQNKMAYQIAKIYAYQHRIDKAFEWLDRAFQLHDQGLLGIKIDPFLHNLHNDPRWRAFLKKMNLPL